MDRQQSELAQQFLLFGSGGTSAHGDRNVVALYGEIVLPIFPILEGHIAVHHEEYSDFGATLNPKVSIALRPRADLLFRASYSEGFQAPSLEQAFGGVTHDFVVQPDFLQRNFTFGVIDTNSPWPFDDFRSREVRTTGNPELQPEESKCFNVGIVWNPSKAKNLTIGFEAWWLNIDNAIGI